MFDPEFYPTSRAAWDAMQVECYGKVVLDPSAGMGTLLQYAKEAGAARCIGIEKNDKLRYLLSSNFVTAGTDWFDLKAEDISHVDMILMNPPYSNADKHILHAFEIAPEGCEIVAQCNAETLKNAHTTSRQQLKGIINTYGNHKAAGQLYKEAERTTDVEVSIIRLFEPVSTDSPKFEGFYFDAEPDNEHSGVVKYNELQAIVNQYIGAVRCFEKFRDVAREMNIITSALGFGEGFNFQVRHGETVHHKADFARALQKHCWKMVFEKFSLNKFLTSGVRKNVNEFVEHQCTYPFTMKNIYAMVGMIIGTAEENIYKAVVEAVDNFTKHTHENRFDVEGWKTNSGHMLNKRFIVNSIGELEYHGNFIRFRSWWPRGNDLFDLMRSLCFLTGKNFDALEDVEQVSCERDENGEVKKYYKYFEPDGSPMEKMMKYFDIKGKNEFIPGQWYEWEFFRFRLYKKGSGHFEFRNIEDWAKLNQAYSKAKGNPLPEQTWKGFKKRESKKKAPEQAEIFA